MVLIPAILRDNADDLNPLACAAAFDRTIALATENLQQNTATLAMQQAERNLDTVLYGIDLLGFAGALTVEVSLFYQVLSARFASELFEFDTPAVKNFRYYYQNANRIPVEVAKTTTIIN